MAIATSLQTANFSRLELTSNIALSATSKKSAIANLATAEVDLEQSIKINWFTPRHHLNHHHRNQSPHHPTLCLNSPSHLESLHPPQLI